MTLALMSVSCSSSRKTVVAGAHQSSVTKPSPGKTATPVSPAMVSRPLESLLSEAHTWQGTPYLWGGNDRDGVDCSGFVTQVFKNALGIKLPRTSQTQSEWCTPLKRSDLRPGDLVFFATDNNREGEVSHVGLYIGDGNMIHSSSSRGVIISSLDNTYYQRTFHSGGRVEQLQAMLNVPSAPVKSPAAPGPDLIVTGTVAATSPEVATINPARSNPATTVPVKEKKPKIKIKKEKEQKPAVAPKPAAPSVKTTPATTASTVTASDARSMFLNSIIEEKVDSIFAY